MGNYLNTSRIHRGNHHVLVNRHLSITRGSTTQSRCVHRGWLGPQGTVCADQLTVEACTSRALPDSKSAILLPPSYKSKKMLPRKRDASQSHTKGPFSGPALTIMSFNVEGLSAAKEQLIADLRQRHLCAVVCIQETHRGPDAIRPSIPGMDLAIERPHPQYGSTIFVTSGTIVNTTSLTDINNIEILRVDLNGISVTSVYKPPGERFSFHQPLTAVGDQQQVIIGDFNSHSSTCTLTANW